MGPKNPTYKIITGESESSISLTGFIADASPPLLAATASLIAFPSRLKIVPNPCAKIKNIQNCRKLIFIFSARSSGTRRRIKNTNGRTSA